MSRRRRHGRHTPSTPGYRPAHPSGALDRPSGPAEDGAASSHATGPGQPDRPASPGMVFPDDPAMPLASAHVEPPAGGFPPVSREPAADERVHLRPPARGRSGPGPIVGRGQPAPGVPDQRGPRDGAGRPDDGAPRASCTVAQLRRFIKSRPWVPLHELRRRFGIYGADDDVTPIRVADQTLFIGLPPAEGRLVEELLVGGDVGYELALDPGAPIVVGVYPMRPVPRG